jgi:RND family efflux transporter MFP subunit
MSQLNQPKRNDALATLRIERADEQPRRSPWRSIIKFFAWLVVLTALFAGGLALANRQGWLSWRELIRPRPEVRVAVVQVQTGRSADALVVATGYLESRRQAKIGAKAPGRIEVLNVEEGSRVSTGQVLAVLEHAELDAALAAANATLQRTKAELAELEIQIAQHRREYKRKEKLRQSGSVSVDDYEQAKMNYDVSVAHGDTLRAAVDLAAARAKEAQQVVENMFVRAPFDGTVISKDAELGESILPGGMGEASGRGSVVTIADLDHLEVDTDVKEDFINRTRIGQPAEVLVDAVPDKRYTGRVRKIIPMGDRARATIKVKVEILDVDERLFPEMSSTVYFLPESSEAAKDAAESLQRRVFCPLPAVQTDERGQFVWLVGPEDQTRRVDVSLGAEHEDRVEIESGLQGGERVIVAPPADLQPNQRVDVAQ